MARKELSALNVNATPASPEAAPARLAVTEALLPDGSRLSWQAAPAVDGGDLSVLLAAWGASPGNAADFNGDGAIDGIDLGVLLANWTL